MFTHLQPELDSDYFQSATPIHQQQQPIITIGYYNLRGKGQVPRLVCEFLQVDYKDELYSLAEWDREKRTKAKQWQFKQVPYLKQGNFVLTEPIPICIYLINRFGSPQLLGKSLEDRALIKMYVWTIQAMGNIININCQKKTAEQLKQLKKNQWKSNVAPRLIKYEEIAAEGTWFLGYFTLIDLSMYELVRYMQLIFPGQMVNFPKLKAIQQRVYNLPVIYEYENSSRAIKETDPTTLLQELKKSKIITISTNTQSMNETTSKGTEKNCSQGSDKKNNQWVQKNTNSFMLTQKIN